MVDGLLEVYKLGIVWSRIFRITEDTEKEKTHDAGFMMEAQSAWRAFSSQFKV